jgi:Zn-dependent peptidase ImmA (M78 family)
MADIRYMRDAERKADSLIQQFKITVPPVPVHEIAQKLGLDVIAYDLGEEVSGTLVVENGKGFIGYNPTHSKKRQRFTIAHEIGHFILHPADNSLFVDQDFIVKYRSNNTYSRRELIQEQQANAFGAALLMPAAFIQTELKTKSSGTMGEVELIETLARLFEVSVPAMTYRLNNLNFTNIL